VKDMVVESPYRPIRPHIYILDKNYDDVNWMNIKLNPAKSASESLAAVESVFRKFAPSLPFDYKFVDEVYAKKFELEERIGILTYIFAGLATFISCLGLIGLASFVAEQHTKEIGIRKIMGATILQLWRLLSAGFIGLVLIASGIAIPFALMFREGWFSMYQYNTEVSWWIFVVTILGAVVITLITVSYHAFRAAMINPVKSLRSE
jgi:putative ABC transport system permease protein